MTDQRMPSGARVRQAAAEPTERWGGYSGIRHARPHACGDAPQTPQHTPPKCGKVADCHSGRGATPRSLPTTLHAAGLLEDDAARGWEDFAWFRSSRAALTARMHQSANCRPPSPNKHAWKCAACSPLCLRQGMLAVRVADAGAAGIARGAEELRRPAGVVRGPGSRMWTTSYVLAVPLARARSMLSGLRKRRCPSTPFLCHLA